MVRSPKLPASAAAVAFTLLVGVDSFGLVENASATSSVSAWTSSSYGVSSALRSPPQPTTLLPPMLSTKRARNRRCSTSSLLPRNKKSSADDVSDDGKPVGDSKVNYARILSPLNPYMVRICPALFSNRLQINYLLKAVIPPPHQTCYGCCSSLTRSHSLLVVCVHVPVHLRGGCRETLVRQPSPGAHPGGALCCCKGLFFVSADSSDDHRPLSSL